MSQYKSLKVKLSNLQINKSKSGTKNGTESITALQLRRLILWIFTFLSETASKNITF